MDADRTIEKRPGQQQQLACSQCKLYQLKLNLLLKDRKQLNEQINELEEMENDSRLMSQNLAQKLFSIEQQFDACKSELEKSYQTETKLQFQVKRLSLELKERFDCVQQLTGKLVKLQAKLSSCNNRQTGDSCKLQASLDVVGRDQPANNNNNNNADNSITAQSTKSPQSVDSAGSSKASSIANDEVPAQAVAASGSSDDDSAIDSTFDERNKSSATALTDGATAGDRCAGSAQSAETFQPERRRIEVIKVQCDDSLYSKSSSASSYANSDDGCRSEPEQLSATQLASSPPDLSPAGSSCDEPAAHFAAKIAPASSSPSSSGDESDHHQASAGQSSSVSNGAASGGEQASRQQVLRKKTSTARGQRSCSQPLPAAQTKRQPICGHFQDLELLEEPSARRQLAQNQARFVLVTDTTTTTTTTLTGSSLRALAVEAGGERQLQPIDLALKGVDDLEKGRLEGAFSALVEATGPTREGDERPDAIGQYKQEIANLRLRLLQAQALNDNLVAELKGCKERSRPEPMANQQQQQQQAKRCSVIYLNGVGCPQAELSLGGSNNFYNFNSNGAGQLQQQQAVDRSQQLESELAEFLRFLLDKIHFHHGRTFELVNECQKLAMKALRASYSHQMNLVHHNEVVLAGNQASLRALPQSHQQQQHPQPIDRYPVRPPPRRRNGNSLNFTANCGTEPANHRMSMQPDDGAASKSGPVEQQQPPPPTVRYSALQVAKQTLFSIVPIYHGGSKGAKEKALEPKLKSQEAGGFGEFQNSKATTNSPSGVGMKNCFVKINQTANDSNVSVLEINNRNVLYQQTTSANPMTALDGGLAVNRVNCSLSEEIERFRVHFNGQLLDLLTRQNSCESIIAEKLKLLSLSGCNGSPGTQFDRPHSMYVLNSSSGAVNRPSVIQPTNAKHLPMSHNIPMTNISLNPNGLTIQSQQHQQQQPMRQSWIINQSQDSSSLC